MSTARVTISIEIDGAITDGGMPTRLGWQHEEHTGGDGNEFYGDAVQHALHAAAHKAITGAAIYVQRRDTVRPHPYQAGAAR